MKTFDADKPARTLTPSNREIEIDLERAKTAGLIEDYVIVPPRNGMPGRRYEVTKPKGEWEELNFVKAGEFVIELREQLIQKEIRRVKGMNKPELLEYAEGKVDVTPGQTKPKILETIIDHLEGN